MGTEDNYKKRANERTARIAHERTIRAETWLFVCEGEKTEPDYFENLLKYANSKSDRKLKYKIAGLGKNTISLVNSVDSFFSFADEQRKKVNIPYGKTFVVFDRDSFGKDKFNNAISIATERGYIPIWSNECFELWFLLHFAYIDSDIGREEYFKKLGTYFGCSYNKSNDNFVKLNTESNLKTAIKNAKKLVMNSDECTSAVKRCPCTMVYQVIEEIENYLCVAL